MKKLLLLIAITSTISAFSQDKVKIYKGLYEGMTRKEVKTEFKSNKADYNSVSFGNGLEWTIKKTGGMLYNPKDYLVGVWMWPKGTLLSGIGYEATVSYLQQSKKFFLSRGYEILLENEWWDKPQNFVGKSYKYGLVLNSKDNKRVVHLYPAEITLMDGKSTNMQAYIKVFTRSFWDKEMNENKKEYENDTKDTDF